MLLNSILALETLKPALRARRWIAITRKLLAVNAGAQPHLRKALPHMGRILRIRQ